jgi:3-hydroxyisobutyrate dehydrogenase-like beta-hydroxyacid dehydrogenase
MTASMATIGIISIGEMGLGIAKLLVASGYRVTTNVTGRRHVIYQTYMDFVASNTKPIVKIHMLEPSQLQ